MANFRYNSPTCRSMCHPMIDPGTLSRNVSNPPGVVGSLLAESLTSLRDAISWEIDRSSLYATLTKEGLGFLVDVYGGKEGGGALPIAEAWDQRIKNMAVAHNTFSSEHRLGAMEPFD